MMSFFLLKETLNLTQCKYSLSLKKLYVLCFLIGIIFFLNSSGIKAQESNGDSLFIAQINIIGNKKTKDHIILREISFTTGAKVKRTEFSVLIATAHQNLLNTSLFNFVTIDTIVQNGNAIISITVAERWYTWPSPFFSLSDRNFNTWWETKDFSHADYGLYLTQENFRGRKESLKAILALGYNQSYGLSYKIPYINKKRTVGIGLSAGFAGNHEVAYCTVDSKQQFFKDKNDFVKKNIYSTFQITYRKQFYTTHTFQINFNSFHFADSLLLLNPDFSKHTDEDYFTFYYLFKNDRRNIKEYPLKGHYIDVEVSKSGFGLLKKENIDALFIHSSMRKFFQLSKRFYFATGINFKISSSSVQPYFYERGLGFGGDYIRGYEYYVIDGQNFAVVKSNFKFEVIPTKVKYFKFIPFKKFNKLYYSLFLNIHGDAGFVKKYGVNKNDALSDKLLFGTGLGLDLVTYYDKVFRVDFSMNKKGEKGIFLHFVAPI